MLRSFALLFSFQIRRQNEQACAQQEEEQLPTQKGGRQGQCSEKIEQELGELIKRMLHGQVTGGQVFS